MRAMIVAAGLGTRLLPLSGLRPKPAMPIRGIPLIAYPLALLARFGVTETVCCQTTCTLPLCGIGRRQR